VSAFALNIRFSTLFAYSTCRFIVYLSSYVSSFLCKCVQAAQDMKNPACSLPAGMLLLGGSAVIHALTGMNIYAAAFLIPIGIIMYTALGGLKVWPRPACL